MAVDEIVVWREGAQKWSAIDFRCAKKIREFIAGIHIDKLQGAGDQPWAGKYVVYK